MNTLVENRIYAGRWDGLDLPPVPSKTNIVRMKIGELEDRSGNIGERRLAPHECSMTAVLVRMDECNFTVHSVTA